MSMQTSPTRQAVVANPNMVFRADSQRTDLLDITMTDSNLIALLQKLLDAGHYILITSVRSDHHDDGPNGHAGGFGFDGWPLRSALDGDYLDATDPRFATYLADVGSFSGLYQLGLAGTAYSASNVKATGIQEGFQYDPCVFQDQGDDHVHHGVHKA
jgi:hypothetical protein